MNHTALNEHTQERVTEAIISIRDIIKTNLEQGDGSNNNHLSNVNICTESLIPNQGTLLLTKEMENSISFNEQGDIMIDKTSSSVNLTKENLKLTNPLENKIDEVNQLAEDLLSKKTTMETTASFSELADIAKKTMINQSQKIENNFDEKNAGQYTLDELMKEMLRPMLKDWLDARLPSLVKWIVTEQIEKILQQQLDKK